MNQVKILISKMNASEFDKISRYVENLEKKIGQKVQATILDPRYHQDYFTFYNQWQALVGSKKDKFRVKNLYLDQYFKSNKENNMNDLIKSFLGDAKVSVNPDNNGEMLLLQDDMVRIKMKKNKSNFIQEIELFNHGDDKALMRALVNHKGNIQTIRTFNVSNGKAIYENYVDSNLKSFLKMEFNVKGQKNSYKFVGLDLNVVYSEIDLYDQWLKMELTDDDYIINLNRDFDVLFSNYVDVNKLYIL